MPMQSDIGLDAVKFAPGSVSEETKKFNDRLIKILESGPRWYEVGAAKYRKMRWDGETPMPKPVVLDSGINSTIPSRDKGREIPCRVFTPEKGQPKGVFMHIHGGGWTLQSPEYQDTLLKFIADNGQLTVVSAGYRLAPEHPYPAGPQDSYDAAEWLVDHAKEQYGADLTFAGGESAGGHLASLVCFHLLKARPNFQFRGLILNFGAYDLSGFLPQVHHFDTPLVLDHDIMAKYISAFVPNTTPTERQNPMISPFYANLAELAASSPHKTLPPALFTCGTADPLLDDTVMMSAKWMMAGAEAVVKIYPGAPHGFIVFPPDLLEAAKQGLADLKMYLEEKAG